MADYIKSMERSTSLVASQKNMHLVVYCSHILTYFPDARLKVKNPRVRGFFSSHCMLANVSCFLHDATLTADSLLHLTRFALEHVSTTA
jgi:hypothetical protein